MEKSKITQVPGLNLRDQENLLIKPERSNLPLAKQQPLMTSCERRPIREPQY